MFTNKKINSKQSRDCKHEAKFWNLSRTKYATRVELKKKILVEFRKKTWVEKERTLTRCVINQCLHFTDTRLRSKGVVCWLPNIADFFFSLARLIEVLERQLSSALYDSSELLFRCLDECERTLATLSSWFCETRCLEIGKFALSTLNLTGTHRFNHP